MPASLRAFIIETVLLRPDSEQAVQSIQELPSGNVIAGKVTGTQIERCHQRMAAFDNSKSTGAEQA
jgi:hypothetical protein